MTNRESCCQSKTLNNKINTHLKIIKLHRRLCIIFRKKHRFALWKGPRCLEGAVTAGVSPSNRTMTTNTATSLKVIRSGGMFFKLIASNTIGSRFSLLTWSFSASLCVPHVSNTPAEATEVIVSRGPTRVEQISRHEAQSEAYKDILKSKNGHCLKSLNHYEIGGSPNPSFRQRYHVF